MPEVLTRVDGKGKVGVKPPQIGTVRYCQRCGRDDHVGTLKDRHFAGGELCAGTVITLEYALVNPEHQRLQSAVIEAAKAEAVAHAASGTFGWASKLYTEQRRLRSAVDALIAFEAENKCQKV